MEWTFTIYATKNPRVVLRILQLFEQQRAEILHIRCDMTGERTTVSIDVLAQPHLAGRIHAKLYNQHDVLQVELAPPLSASRTEETTSVEAV